MYSFHFEIQLNDLGRPIIVPIDDDTNSDVNSIEVKFMAAEITRAVYQNMIETINDSADRVNLSDDQVNTIEAAYLHINKLTSTMAYTLKNNLELSKIYIRYDIQVPTDSDRDNLNYNGIIYDGKIFFRVEGLRVKILDDESIYELKGGIDNQHWVKVN